MHILSTAVLAAEPIVHQAISWPQAFVMAVYFVMIGFIAYMLFR